jgi:hypothetical protein
MASATTAGLSGAWTTTASWGTALQVVIQALPVSTKPPTTVIPGSRAMASM